MPITYLNVRMKQRIGLASEWKADNPLLLKGELGIESDTGYVKSGDGSTRYNDLLSHVPSGRNRRESGSKYLSAGK